MNTSEEVVATLVSLDENESWDDPNATPESMGRVSLFGYRGY